jgi:heterodisulfide reductase subunit A-like polyferredoxin
VQEFIGCALPRPITDFMHLTSEKEISDRDTDLCVECGNCTNCGYQAITVGRDGFPVTNPAKCIGCSICVKTCFTGAMMMRGRTLAEAKLTPE